jgi:Protein of unknown function (DUF2769)
MAQVPDTPQNESLCICGGCPSFPGKGVLFCAKGASKERVRERGCICPDCKVYGDSHLRDFYYCEHGQAK